MQMKRAPQGEVRRLPWREWQGRLASGEKHGRRELQRSSGGRQVRRRLAGGDRKRKKQNAGLWKESEARGNSGARGVHPELEVMGNAGNLESFD